MNKQQINNALDLLDQGNTPHYIAKYKKELVGNTNPAEIRNLRHTPAHTIPDDSDIYALLDSITNEVALKREPIK